MKQMSKIIKETSKSVSILSFIIATIILLLYGLYWSSDSLVERLFILALTTFILIPMIIAVINFIISLIINLSFSKAKNDNKKKEIINNYNDPIKTNKKYQEKTVLTEGYKEFNNLLKASMQNKLMDRGSVLKLKYELINRLGTHMEVYKDFNFKNDMHCIYILSKSSRLTTDDYNHLSEFLSDNLIFPE